MAAARKYIPWMRCRQGNLGNQEQNRRLRMSLSALAIGLLLSIWLLRAGVAAPYRALLFFPFFAAAFGAYQGLFRTCSAAARRGVRFTDHGEEVVASPAERAHMRRDARKIVLGSLVTAAVATALIVFLP